MKAATEYNPFDREEQRELEREAEARLDHQKWSLEQSRKGQSAAQRENTGTWLKRAPDLELPPESTEESAAWAQSPAS